jgi:hypothetical protein
MAALIPLLGTTVAQGLTFLGGGILEEGLKLFAQATIFGTVFAATAEGIHDVANYVRGKNDPQKQMQNVLPMTASAAANKSSPSSGGDYKSKLDSKVPDLLSRMRNLKEKLGR